MTHPIEASFALFWKNLTAKNAIAESPELRAHFRDAFIDGYKLGEHQAGERTRDLGFYYCGKDMRNAFIGGIVVTLVVLRLWSLDFGE